MQKPSWLKSIENHYPERLKKTNDRLEEYTKSLATSIKSKSDYIEIAVPGLYEYNTLRKIPQCSKNLRIAAGALSTGYRLTGIAGFLATGDTFYIWIYGAPTALFGCFKALDNRFEQPRIEQKKIDVYS